MKEAYFDPALQKHLERRALIHKWQARRALFKKYRVLIASSAVSLETLTTFLTMNKQLERYAWFMAENDIRSLGVFVGILEVLQANGTEISTYSLGSFIDQLQDLKNDFEEILLKQEEKDDNL